MAVFDHISMGEEGLKEIYQWLDDWVAKNKGIARGEVIGKSLDHWDIPAGHGRTDSSIRSIGELK